MFLFSRLDFRFPPFLVRAEEGREALNPGLIDGNGIEDVRHVVQGRTHGSIGLQATMDEERNTLTSPSVTF